MSAPDLPRFKVSSTGLDVLDTWWAHRTVAFFAADRGERINWAREQAARLRDELEAWHAEAMADG